ncbi:4Fe-4S dicluster domain-containing protein [Anaeroselena agilis]|uniref:4Fe-4S dicluster domain-containing protein n=1 Tax=Anaeroselena agilis TaxID=3063788 RepID=UPI0039B6F226
MREEIIAAVRDAGVVGAGGAGFPTHVKIDARVDTVVANGAECEPLLRADQEIMAKESDKVVAGLAAVMLATGAGRGVIALKRKYAEAAANLAAAIGLLGDRRLELFFLPDFYPAGDEQVLVYEATRRVVPEGGIPLNVGAVVVNVETLVNVAEALAGKAVTDKYLTVTGEVAQPLTIRAPVGISAREVIALAGGATVDDFAIIDGGPLMGKLVALEAVVTKTTGGFIVLPRKHPAIAHKVASWTVIANRAKAACCSCRGCTDGCPRYLLGHGLEPHRIMQVIGGGLQDNAAVTRALLCSECGACEAYGCTMGLSPRRVIAELKAQLAKAGVKNPHRAEIRQARWERDYRRIPTKRLVARLGLEKYDRPAPFSTSPIPDEVRLPLLQHIGVPACPVVRDGDKVEAGDLVAVIPQGAAVGANLHASIAGEVFTGDGYIGIKARSKAGGMGW